jgi:putative salt-induced outer membrane protein
MKYSMIAIATLASLATANAFAQAVPTDGLWRGNLGGGLTISSGNSKNTNINLGADAVQATADGKLSLYLNAIRGEDRGVDPSKVSADAQHAGGRYEFNVSPQTYAFGSLDFDRDSLQALNLRSVIGGGMGYHVLKTADTTFDVFGGLAFNAERYKEPIGSKNSTELILGEESTHKLSDSANAKQRLTLYPNLKDSGEYRAVFDAGVSTAIAGGLNLNVGLSDRYNSRVPAGLKKNDMVLFTNVSMKFGAPAK